MQTINLNGISLAYTRRGKGTPLVLVHGYPLDHTIWNEVTPLLENTFDLILPDMRGFGESTTIDEPYSMDDMAGDIAGLLDHLGIEKAAMAGHSMGGYIALAFARLYPTRVRGLGLVSSQALADTLERKQGRYDTAAQVAGKGVGIVAEAMAPKLSSDTRVESFARQLIEKQSSAGVIGALKAMAERGDSTSLLSLLKYAVVILHGSSDVLIPVERGREIKEAIPHAEYFELAGVGHMPMMEAAGKTAEALKYLK
ncbi:MAG: alpha/beta hydrolase [Chloroflexi bacterium]|nr:alpha/beta hydrolase [Chloroflexota bacterium]